MTNKYHFTVGCDVRAYVSVTVNAETPEKALEHLTADYVADHADFSNADSDCETPCAMTIIDCIDEQGEPVTRSNGESFQLINIPHGDWDHITPALEEYHDRCNLEPSDAFASPEGQPTNEQRADWADMAVEVIEHETGSDWRDGDKRSPIAFADLLVNLRHLADRHGFDVEDMWSKSRKPYRQEIAEQPKVSALCHDSSTTE